MSVVSSVVSSKCGIAAPMPLAMGGCKWKSPAKGGCASASPVVKSCWHGTRSTRGEPAPNGIVNGGGGTPVLGSRGWRSSVLSSCSRTSTSAEDRASHTEICFAHRNMCLSFFPSQFCSYSSYELFFVFLRGSPPASSALILTCSLSSALLLVMNQLI